MTVITPHFIGEQVEELIATRRDLHAHPELGFEEFRTSALVADRLRALGLEPRTGVGRTGVLARIVGGRPGRTVLLRADMDALPIHEENDVPYRSMTDGKMHACGHDCHTSILLGIARQLVKEQATLPGTVVLCFQPSEEQGHPQGGAQAMIDDGALEWAQPDFALGLHVWQGLPLGTVGVTEGAWMAATDSFEVTFKGRGAHAAIPHAGLDPVVALAHAVTALQSIVARNVDPMDTAVVSTTQIHAGDTWNVIPQECVLRGTVRTFKKPVQDMIEKSIERVARNVAAGFGAEVTKWRYERRYPATVNTEQETEFAAHAAAALVGKENVNRNPTPAMGSEDFAWMLLKKPGCYIWIGNGDGAGSCMVHNPGYDFNDDILPIGASYWATLVEQQLARQALGQAAE